MCNRNSLFRANKGLVCILTAILVVASFLGIPGNLKSYAGETEELYFCILHTNDMHSELIPHSPAVDYDPEEEDPTIGGFARLATAVKRRPCYRRVRSSGYRRGRNPREQNEGR